MSGQIEIFEFTERRGQCIQALYKNQIYRKHSGNIYHCYIKTCGSLISLDTETFTAIKPSTAHLGHKTLSNFRFAVIRKVALMKARAKNESTLKISTNYLDGLKHLTDVITDINAPLISGF